MTASAGPVLKRLNDEFHDRVAFLTLYVREAHPGEQYPRPQTFDRKMEHAGAVAGVIVLTTGGSGRIAQRG